MSENGVRPGWARRLQEERERRGWNKHQMARRLQAAVGMHGQPVDSLVRQIRGWEAGRHNPRDWRAAYAKAFERDEEELFDDEIRDEIPRPAQRPPDTQAAPNRELFPGTERLAVEGTVLPSLNPLLALVLADLNCDSLTTDSAELSRYLGEQICPRCGGPEQVKRRDLLQMGILAGTSVPLASELVRHALERTLETAETYTVEDWELACLDHTHALLTGPPAAAHAALIIDLAAVNRQIRRAQEQPAPDLNRIAAWLSTLNANALTRMGNHDDARRWWATARRAADVSGDVDMQVWVRGKEAVFGLYAPRPLESVVTLARVARQRAGGRASAGLLSALSAEAQALATMNRPKEAERALHELTDLSDRVDDGRAYGWTEDSVWFVRSWVYAYLGDDRAADEARDRVIASATDYQNPANARLHEAIRITRQGGDLRGLRKAVEIVGELEPAYRSHMILRTASRVLDAVPVDQRDQPAVRDFKAALTAHAPDA